MGNIKKKGRARELIELRDKKLAERFSYWYFYRRLQLDVVLEILEKREFFLSKQRIWHIIKDKKGLNSDEAIKKCQRQERLYSGNFEGIFPTKDNHIEY